MSGRDFISAEFRAHLVDVGVSQEVLSALDYHRGRWWHFIPYTSWILVPTATIFPAVLLMTSVWGAAASDVREQLGMSAEAIVTFSGPGHFLALLTLAWTLTYYLMGVWFFYYVPGFNTGAARVQISSSESPGHGATGNWLIGKTAQRLERANANLDTQLKEYALLGFTTVRRIVLVSAVLTVGLFWWETHSFTAVGDGRIVIGDQMTFSEKTYRYEDIASAEFVCTPVRSGFGGPLSFEIYGVPGEEGGINLLPELFGSGIGERSVERLLGLHDELLAAGVPVTYKVQGTSDSTDIQGDCIRQIHARYPELASRIVHDLHLDAPFRQGPTSQ